MARRSWSEACDCSFKCQFGSSVFTDLPGDGLNLKSLRRSENYDLTCCMSACVGDFFLLLFFHSWLLFIPCIYLGCLSHVMLQQSQEQWTGTTTMNYSNYFFCWLCLPSPSSILNCGGIIYEQKDTCNKFSMLFIPIWETRDGQSGFPRRIKDKVKS